MFTGKLKKSAYLSESKEVVIRCLGAMLLVIIFLVRFVYSVVVFAISGTVPCNKCRENILRGICFKLKEYIHIQTKTI